MWHVCARPRGVYESVIWKGVEEGNGEGEVEDGSWHLVESYKIVPQAFVFSGSFIVASNPPTCATELVVDS